MPHPQPVFVNGEPVFFLQGARANEDVSDRQRSETVRILKSYHEAFRRRGIRFIFLPVPNKENIYHDFLPAGKRPVFLEKLISELDKSGIETIDTQKAFDEAFGKGVELYLNDDTHWSAAAVRITAELIEKQVGMKGE